MADELDVHVIDGITLKPPAAEAAFHQIGQVLIHYVAELAGLAVIEVEVVAGPDVEDHLAAAAEPAAVDAEVRQLAEDVVDGGDGHFLGPRRGNLRRYLIGRSMDKRHHRLMNGHALRGRLETVLAEEGPEAFDRRTAVDVEGHRLELAAECEVAGVTQTRDDVAVAGQFLVDGRDPEGDVGGELLLEVFDGVAAGDGAHQVGVGRLAALFEELVVSDFDGGAGGEHRVGDDEGLAGDLRGRAVVDLDLEVITLSVFAERGNEGRLGVVEHVENALVQRQTGTHDRGDDELGVVRSDLGGAERRDDILDGIIQRPGNLIAEDLAYALEIGPEAEAVFLDGGIAHFCDESVEDGVVLAKIDDLHRKWYLKIG